VALQQPGGVTNNRIASVNGGASYQYDAAGNTTYDAAHSFNYDGESRIVNVDSGSTATYFYDAANRRVKKAQGGFTTYYIWEGNKVIAEYSNAPGGAGGTRFYHPDRLSNRAITDGSGVVKGTMDNLPFGEDAGTGSGETEKHRFTSYERDSETGSDYAINRQYSNVTGRFNRADPFDGSYDFGNPQSLNRYAYVNNEPTNMVDPFGLVRTCLPSLVNPGCWVCQEDDGSLTVDCRQRDVVTLETRPGPIFHLIGLRDLNALRTSHAPWIGGHRLSLAGRSLGRGLIRQRRLRRACPNCRIRRKESLRSAVLETRIRILDLIRTNRWHRRIHRYGGKQNSCYRKVCESAPASSRV
jgi:RHS repeat-associated protein